MVPGKDGAYFYHVVAAKETIYSLSRTYGLEPKHLAAFNGLTLKSALKIYQLLKIPLTSADLDQVSASPPGGAVPLYHKVTPGETLYHIAKLQGDVPVAHLKQWNDLKGNGVHPGQFLVVGWLKKGGAASAAPKPAPAVQEAAPVASENPQSTPSAASSSTPVATPPAVAAAPKPAPALQEAAPVASEKPQSTPSPTAPASAPSTATAAADDGFLGEVIASENESRNRSKPARAVASGSAAAAPASEEDAFSVSPPPSLKKNPVKAAKAEPAAGHPAATEKKVSAATPPPQAATEKPAALPAQAAPSKPDSFALLLNKVTHVSGKAAPAQPTAAQPATPVPDAEAETPATVKSAFQTQFEEQTANGTKVTVKKGAAGWFKSNVKPGSGRYYALCNDLPRGTIVRVVNPINQKSVLVKVLDVIPHQKDNYNLIIKLSDAAMGDLGVTQSRFWCEINYPGQQP